MRTKITSSFFLDLSVVVCFHYIPDGDSTLFIAYNDKPIFVTKDDAKALRDKLDDDHMREEREKNRYEHQMQHIETDNSKLAGDCSIF